MSQTIAIVLGGFSLGILIGLTVSPVVGTAISITLTVITSGAAILAGIQPSEAGKHVSVRMWPVSILVVALLIGALVGIRARASRVLGNSPESTLERWTAKPFNLPREIVAKRLFESFYPEVDKIEAKNSPENAGGSPGGAAGPYLYAGSGESDVCIRLLGVSDAYGIRQILKRQSTRYWSRIAMLTQALQDDDLRRTRDDLCSSK